MVDRLRAPRPPLRFNPKAKYANNAVLVLAPGYGDANGGRPLYPSGGSWSNTSFDGNEFGNYSKFGLRDIHLNQGLTTASSRLERINVTSNERLEAAITTGEGFSVRFIAKLNVAGPSEFDGFGRIISKQITGATNTNFEIVTKDDGALKVERRTTGSPNNVHRTSNTGFFVEGGDYTYIVVTFLNSSVASADLLMYADGVEATYPGASQEGGTAIIASDTSKAVHIGDRGNGGRECNCNFVYMDILNVILSPQEVADSYSNMWDLVAPQRRRVYMPVAAAVGGLSIPVAMRSYRQHHQAGI